MAVCAKPRKVLRMVTPRGSAGHHSAGDALIADGTLRDAHPLSALAVWRQRAWAIGTRSRTPQMLSASSARLRPFEISGTQERHPLRQVFTTAGDDLQFKMKFLEENLG